MYITHMHTHGHPYHPHPHTWTSISSTSIHMDIRKLFNVSCVYFFDSCKSIKETFMVPTQELVSIKYIFYVYINKSDNKESIKLNFHIVKLNCKYEKYFQNYFIYNILL